MVYVRWSQIGKGKLHSYFFFFGIAEDGTKTLHTPYKCFNTKLYCKPRNLFPLKKNLISLGCLSESVMYI